MKNFKLFKLQIFKVLDEVESEKNQIEEVNEKAVEEYEDIEEFSEVENLNEGEEIAEPVVEMGEEDSPIKEGEVEILNSITEVEDEPQTVSENDNIVEEEKEDDNENEEEEDNVKKFECRPRRVSQVMKAI